MKIIIIIIINKSITQGRQKIIFYTVKVFEWSRQVVGSEWLNFINIIFHIRILNGFVTTVSSSSSSSSPSKPDSWFLLHLFVSSFPSITSPIFLVSWCFYLVGSSCFCGDCIPIPCVWSLVISQILVHFRYRKR